jgi:hypothetical protein
MLDFAAERLMEFDVGSKTGAALGEKSPDRVWCGAPATAMDLGDVG